MLGERVASAPRGCGLTLDEPSPGPGSWGGRAEGAPAGSRASPRCRGPARGPRAERFRALRAEESAPSGRWYPGPAQPSGGLKRLPLAPGGTQQGSSAPRAEEGAQSRGDPLPGVGRKFLCLLPVAGDTSAAKNVALDISWRCWRGALTVPVTLFTSDCL